MMALKTTTDLLEINVFGAGKGESIVLRWPDDKWGVVDCYNPSQRNPESNLTWRFLQDSQVRELEFICLTHPHDDHYRGMSQLLAHFSVKFFWRFAGLSATHLNAFAKHLVLEARRGGSEERKISANDFVRTMSQVRVQRQNQLRQKTATGFQQLYPVPADPKAHFQIWSFAPSGNRVADYEHILASRFPIGKQPLLRESEAEHNSISMGLLVRFGDTRLVLGGDIEESGWSDVLAEIPREELASHLVKVSHHGSKTGYVDGLWEAFSAQSKPIAVIAPYRRFNLPEPEAIGHIKPFVSKILLTCDLDDEPPAAIPAPVKSRTLLSMKMKIRPAPKDSPHGQCTLQFDPFGNCVYAEAVELA